ncbi:MAG: hypothetical protein JNN04_08925 [Cyclobacteriaceae bacterium]|nr:hypothetical protein [Cyclobacteriaceae bacterium]
MAKAASKTPAKAPKKAAAPKKKPATPPYQLIEEVCKASLAKLQELELDYQLQSEINWCLGSFQNDGNPVGLYLMAERALAIFKAELAAKRKGVTAQLVKDIEKALKDR